MNIRTRFHLFCICLIWLQIMLSLLIYIGAFTPIIGKEDMPFCIAMIIIFGAVIVMVAAGVTRKKEEKEKRCQRNIIKI